MTSNSFDSKASLTVEGKDYSYFDLRRAQQSGLTDIDRLPFSLKVVLENLLRSEDGKSVNKKDLEAFPRWLKENGKISEEIAYRPARVLMQDFTGVPAVVDLAAMRDAAEKLGASPLVINPQVPVHLVIDHSVMVDYFGGPDSFEKNVQREYERNEERYRFLRWGSTAFDNFHVVPPGTGICHQVNLEHIGQAVWVREENGEAVAFPDTLVGTDSHTTMINGIGVLGWGVGGIEAEAAMLGQPISMLLPEVIGFELTGALSEGATATDLVLRVVEMLREKGVVGKFVEFFGDGLDQLSLEDRATIANMAPEYGATCGFFPVDSETLRYLRATGRDDHRVALVEAYCKAQGLFRERGSRAPVFTDTLSLDMRSVVSSLAGPIRPQDRIDLTAASAAFRQLLDSKYQRGGGIKAGKVAGADYEYKDGDVAIAAITSCTNTSNPSVMIAAGLLARNARERGLSVKPWVKTSLAPGSQVVTDYLEKAGLQDDLDALGFNLVGYGCTTCIGNSGPLPEPISRAINENDLVACSVLSGNRNFEGRVSPDARANYLASPPLVVAYALAGSLLIDITRDPIGADEAGQPVYLKDIWPSSKEIADVVRAAVTPQMFRERYADVYKGDEYWAQIEVDGGQTYNWDPASTYIANPPYFNKIAASEARIEDVKDAQILALLGESVTTDHISPAGSIAADSPAGDYLKSRNVERKDFNSYGSRRGNHEVMMRGTFANIRIRNQMVPGVEGSFTKFIPTGETMPIYDAAMRYAQMDKDLVVFAGKEYGTGSSRDWAAKGTNLLGVKAVIVESFERIHRSNLIGMGVLPLQFTDGNGWPVLGLTGAETISIAGLDELRPRQKVMARISKIGGEVIEIETLLRIDTANELDYYRAGGILSYVLKNLALADA